MMRALVISVSDPLNYIHSLQKVEITRRRRIRSLVPKTRLPFICSVNGKILLRASWNMRVRDGDVVSFVTLPQGGDNGSNPLQLILALAISIVAPQLGMMVYQEAALALGATITSVGSTIAATMGTIAGMALINTLVPPPSLPSSLRNQSLVAPSPTYSLGAQGNAARVGQPIPVSYGRHPIYPDWGAQPYTENTGNEQYLYQLLVIGQGYHNIEQIRLEDTVVASTIVDDGGIYTADGSFEEVQYQVVQPGGVVTLFPTNVVPLIEVSGQELLGAMTGTYSQSGTTITVTKTAHGLTIGKNINLDFTSGTAADGDFIVVGVPTADTFTVTAASLTTSGNVTITTYLGPYVVNASGTEANALGFDLAAPRGLYLANVEGALSTKSISVKVVTRLIDDVGAPLGSWVDLTTLDMQAASTTPQRTSSRVEVANGRYEVKLRRTDVKDTDLRAGHDCLWTGGKAFFPGVQTYGEVTVLAIRIRASNQLSGMASRKINVITTRKIPVWNGTTWSAPTPTRSIAWAFADVCRANYGLALPDSRIDLAKLLYLDSVWSARGDYFDGVFDSLAVAWEALQLISKVGRAFPFQQGGVITLTRDEPQTLPSFMLTTRNIVKGSFRLDYAMPSEETADAVDVSYFDSSVWQERTVRAALPGSTESKVVKVKLFGCTNRDHAWREGMYLAACNKYRRRHVTVGTELEGLIPSLGDLGAIQHDMPRWGQSGEIIEYGRVSNFLAYSEDYTQTAWVKGSTTISPNTLLSPNGGLADKLVEAATAGDHNLSQNCALVLTSPGQYSGSIYLHAGERSKGTLQLRNVAGSSGVFAIFDLVAGTVAVPEVFGTYWTAVESSVVYIGSGWYRLTISGNFTGGDGIKFYLGMADDTGSTSYAGVVGNGIYVHGAQVAPGLYKLPHLSTQVSARQNVDVLVLTEPLDWSAGGNHYMALQKRDGGVWGPTLVTAGGQYNSVEFTEYIAADVDTGHDRERTRYAFGPGTAQYIKVRPIAIKPKSGNNIELVSVVESDYVHMVDTGAAPPASAWQLQTLTTRPVIEGLVGRSDPDDPSKMFLSWKAAAGADRYLIEVSDSGNGWTRIGEPSTPNYSVSAPYGPRTMVRVCAVGLVRGPWIEIWFGGSSCYGWSGSDATLAWTTDSALAWNC